MSKLSLDLEQLVVESFPTTDPRWDGRGTVRGMDSATIDQDTCDSCEECTDFDSCAGTCGATCGASCASCPQSCDPAQCPSADGRPTCDPTCDPANCPSADGRC